jgi:probable addiction module antidote protein
MEWMTMKRLVSVDPAEGLSSDEAIAAFRAHVFESGNAGDIAHTLGVVAHAKGMAQIAAESSF